MATELAALPRFEVRPLSSAEGGGYFVEFLDYPGCVADGDTPEEAIREARDALTSYLATLEDLEPTDSDDASTHQSLRLDADVFSAYRKRGPDWQADMNRVLRERLRLENVKSAAVSSQPTPSTLKESSSMTEKSGGQLYVERRAQGDYAVRRPGSERASDILPTQRKAIARARELSPDSTPMVERVRNTAAGKPDKWRGP
jgi:predicted RNase H-like HicB family nuclease